ncbi:hypothetical protein Ahy_A05g023728 [Arachis hypogaea]|uniref:Uncharacterized protein n=1 Tax=Arachis hypogaea TaxID=3818 RepID=A0A445D4C0_ARAHY|nr:hypothetical protein Ahy_A05g023728 [Arachis hypogaea]
MTKPGSGATDKQHVEDFYNEYLNFTPFMRRNCGPAWLERLLFPNDTEESELATWSWANLQVVQVIPTRLSQHKKEKLKVTLYTPHVIARQLCFSQAILTPLPRNNKPFCHTTLTSQSELDFCLLKNQQQREHFNFLVYDCSSYITKSCFEWWIAYYSRKADPTASSRQPQRKSRRTPTRTSKRLQLQPSSESSDESGESIRYILTASSQLEDTANSDSEFVHPIQIAFPPPIGTQVVDLTIEQSQHSPTRTLSTGHTSSVIQVAPSSEYQVASDFDSPSRVVETTGPDSDSASRVLETLSSPQRTSSPLQQAEFQTPPGQGSGSLGVSSKPTSATLANLVSILNQAIQEDEVPIPAPILSGPSFELNVDAQEQLRSLLKLLDRPLAAWINDAILNQLLSNLLNSAFEFSAPTPLLPYSTNSNKLPTTA